VSQDGSSDDALRRPPDSPRALALSSQMARRVLDLVPRLRERRLAFPPEPQVWLTPDGWAKTILWAHSLRAGLDPTAGNLEPWELALLQPGGVRAFADAERFPVPDRLASDLELAVLSHNGGTGILTVKCGGVVTRSWAAGLALVPPGAHVSLAITPATFRADGASPDASAADGAADSFLDAFQSLDAWSLDEIAVLAPWPYGWDYADSLVQEGFRVFRPDAGWSTNLQAVAETPGFREWLVNLDAGTPPVLAPWEAGRLARLFEVISHFNSLTSLRVRFQPDPALFALLWRLPMLNFLSIPRLGDEILTVLLRLRALRSLSLSGGLSLTNPSALEGLANLEALEVTEWDDSALFAISCLSGLRSLRLGFGDHNLGLTAAGVSSLERLTNLELLELHLGDATASDDALLPLLARIPRLRRIRMESGGPEPEFPTDATILALAASANLEEMIVWDEVTSPALRKEVAALGYSERRPVEDRRRSYFTRAL
jgi:hypothetical protein